MRTITQFMTKQPWTVEVDDSIALAREMLAERRIRHLPVMYAGRLVGMIGERDLEKATALGASTVGQVMTSAAEVHAGMPIAEALRTMSDSQRDALVITSDGHVEGIFTAMDAVRVLADRMRARIRRPEGHGGARHRPW